MIDKTDIEMKEKNENGKNDTGISIETLKQMGYNYPFTVRRIIEGIEQGKDLKDIKSGLVESRIAEKQKSGAEAEYMAQKYGKHVFFVRLTVVFFRIGIAVKRAAVLT